MANIAKHVHGDEMIQLMMADLYSADSELPPPDGR